MVELTSGHGAPSFLAAAEGQTHLTASEVLLKGLCESEEAVVMLAAPADSVFSALRYAALQPDNAALLSRHGLDVVPVPQAARGLELALRRVDDGGSAVVLVGARASELSVPATLPRGAGLCIVQEIDPVARPGCDPVTDATMRGGACLVPGDLHALRDHLEWAVMLSRIEQRPAMVVVHQTLLRSSDVLDNRPNRVGAPAELALRRQRRPRPASGDPSSVLRTIRRAELNRLEALPSPGERVAVGFVTLGPCGAILRQAAHELGLTGRVPHLDLAVTSPLDLAGIERLLSRCEEVFVLEPQPGLMEGEIRRAADRLRLTRGTAPRAIWGREFPVEESSPEAPARVAADEMTYPSCAMRRLHRVLGRIRPLRTLPPALTVSDRAVAPPRGNGLGATALLDTLREPLEQVNRWLAERATDPDYEGSPVPALVIDGPVPAGRRLVPTEFWTARAFTQTGAAAVRHAARLHQAGVMVIADVDRADTADPLRLARAAVAAADVSSATVEEVTLENRNRFTELMREAADGSGLFVLVIRDDPPRYDSAELDREQAEIDRLGFLPRQQLVGELDRLCAVRPPAGNALDGEPTALRTLVRVDHLPRTIGPWPRWRIRPMIEQVEILRSRPPVGQWRRASGERLPLPEVIHARATQWRAHLAGVRGRAPGVVTEVLIRAGRQMGFVVRTIHDPQPIGPGRRVGAQVLFTHAPRAGRRLDVTARMACGSADLLLGLDAGETLRAIDEDAHLLVADPKLTFAVVNTGRFEDEPEAAAVAREVRLRDRLAVRVRRDLSRHDDFCSACRATFHSERLTDLALLGVAFQLGLIPVTLEAIETATHEIELSGIGRAREALTFGRHMATLEPRAVRARAAVPEDEDVDRLVRRMAHVSRVRGGAGVEPFLAMLRESVDGMPGLRETDRGRRALRDFVIATARCRRWGGLEFARRYTGLITDLYAGDRGSAGRDLTQHAILPLAAVMLIRDPSYYASVVTGPEHRLYLRRRLDVKRGREDRIERRFLTRFEIIIGAWRFRADVRTSDWAARLAVPGRFVIPQRWRGSRRERELRDSVIELVRACAVTTAEEYAAYQSILHRLHQAAVDNRIRGLSPEACQLPGAYQLAEAGDA